MVEPSEPTAHAAGDLVAQLSLARYRMGFRGDAVALQALRGRYLGSAWRGAFGRVLRRSVCVTKLPTCGNCVLLQDCVYPRTFENRTPPDAQKLRLYPTTPNPYVLAQPCDGHDNADGADGAINLGITLFGAANDDAPAILQALLLAGKGGITNRRVVLDHIDTQAETPQGRWVTIQPEGGGLRIPPARSVTPPDGLTPPTAVRLRLLSPLRIRADGHVVSPDKLSFRAFASNLLRRISLLTHFFSEHPLEADFAALLDDAAAVRIADAQLRWREGARRSSRQQARIPMGGIVGSFVAEGPAIATLWPCLWLGQWTHIGKGCTMGLGRYALEPVSAGGAAHWQGPASL